MKNTVLKICKEVDSSINFNSNKLVDDGLLDSVTLVELVSELMDQLHIEIPYEEIVPGNFNSVDAITELVKKYV